MTFYITSLACQTMLWLLAFAAATSTCAMWEFSTENTVTKAPMSVIGR